MRKITRLTETFEDMIFSQSFQDGGLRGNQLDFKIDFDGVISKGDEIVLQHTDNDNVTTDVVVINLKDDGEGFLEYQVKILDKEFDYVQFDYALCDDDCLIGFFAKNYGLTIINGDNIVYSPLIELSGKIGVKAKTNKLVNRVEMSDIHSMVLFEDTLILNGGFFIDSNRNQIDVASKKINLSELFDDIQLETYGDIGLINIKTAEEENVIRFFLDDVDIDALISFLKEVKENIWEESQTLSKVLRV